MVILSMKEFDDKLDIDKEYTKKFIELGNICKKDKNNFNIDVHWYFDHSLQYNSYPWRKNIYNKYIGFIEKNNKIVCCMFAEDDTYFRDKQNDCKYWSKNGDCEINPDFMQSECALSCRRLKYKNFKPHKTLIISGSYTHPKYRGKGLCSILTQEYIKKFKNYIIYLAVDKTNLSNMNCKLKNNFVILSGNPRNDKFNMMVHFPKLKRKKIKSKSIKRNKKKKTKRR